MNYSVTQFKCFLLRIMNKIPFFAVTTISLCAQLKIFCEITASIAGNCVLCCFNSEFTKKINKITYKTDKNTNIFVILLVLFVIILIFFVNSLLKQKNSQLPAMRAVISRENF
jgi:hypothetical protein